MLQLVAGTVIGQIPTGQGHFKRSTLEGTFGREEKAVLAVAGPAQGQRYGKIRLAEAADVIPVVLRRLFVGLDAGRIETQADTDRLLLADRETKANRPTG